MFFDHNDMGPIMECKRKMKCVSRLMKFKDLEGYHVLFGTIF